MILQLMRILSLLYNKEKQLKMSNNKHKYILGAVNKGSKSAIMEFYGEVDYFSTMYFIDEFKYLEQLGVKNLTIRINSVGGNVHEGMSVYNTIINSSMHVTTINESVAMSMGSIIWSAGDEVKMRDVAILMLHKPYISNADEDDKDTQAYIDSMDFQLRNIYSKRFGLSDDLVDSIMTGEDGIDGTYFTATQAVEAGFLKSDNIIATPPIVKDEYSSILSLQNKKEYAYAIAKVDFNAVAEAKDTEKQLSDKKNTINNQTVKNKKMEDAKLVIASTLGLSKEADLMDITNKITALNKLGDANASLKKDLSAQQAVVEDLKSKMTEKDAELVALKSSEGNLKANNQTLQAKLDVYVQAEVSQKEAEITALINKAVTDKRITEDSKEIFIEMAKNNFEQASKLIAGIIPAESPEEISEQIATNPKNLKNAADGSKSEADRLSEKIMAAKGIK